MDVKAIVLVGGSPDQPATFSPSTPGTVAGVPAALIDVLGRSVLLRLHDRLRRYGVHEICTIMDQDAGSVPDGAALGQDGNSVIAGGEKFWRAVENSFNELAQSGADIVIVVRLGAWAEIDYDALLQAHLDQKLHVTSVVDQADNSLDVFAITASRRNHAAFLLRHRLRRFRNGHAKYVYSGYCNPLRTAADLRQLTIDGLMQRADVSPIGRELKPGVWVGPGAHVHRTARVVAPAYLGAFTCVRASAVITRGTALEHHAVVDCGTVVENASLLPYTYVAAGLDLAHAVVGWKRIASLKRGVEIAVDDSHLIALRPQSAPVRALGSLASLAGFLPMQFLRGVFAPSHREQPSALPGAAASSDGRKSPVSAPASAVPQPEHQFPADFVVARRYGDH